MARYATQDSLEKFFKELDRRITRLERAAINPATGGGVGSGSVNKVSELIGNGTDTEYIVDHNFGTKQVIVQVFRNSAPYDEIFVDKELTTDNVVTIKFSRIVTTDEFRVVIVG
jgi:hypothetical protein